MAGREDALETHPKQDQSPSHAQTAAAMVKLLASNAVRGLSAGEAQQRLQHFGPNKLQEAAAIPAFVRFIAQFKSAVVLILIGASLLAAFLGEWLDAWAIGVIVLINAGLGYAQEAKAEKSLRALKQLAAPQASVIRDACRLRLAAAALVPGDVIELEAGDAVPADARLIASFGLKVQEAALTGESEAVAKESECVLPCEQVLAERSNMIYLGTSIVSGQARALVVATGMATEMGHIAELLQQQPVEPTPLQRRLSELGRVLALLCLTLIALIAVIHVLRGGDDFRSIVLFASSLAVAVIPEGIPAIVTISLALGLTRMAKRQALIRYLPSVETLGSVTVIGSDKTGTLTRNEMTLTKISLAKRSYKVTGVGYEERGSFELESSFISDDAMDPAEDPDLGLALTIGAQCNHASLVLDKHRIPPAWTVMGDPTEGAFLVAARKAGLPWAEPTGSIIHEKPFDANRKLMSVVMNDERGRRMMFSKGAPEAILTICSHELVAGTIELLNEARREAILEKSQSLAAHALRILGLAYRSFDETASSYEEDGLIFVGLAGLFDPPREEVRVAIRTCKAAGIRPVMISGDHPVTAQTIAKELGIAAEAAKTVTGQALDSWTEQDWNRRISEYSVFARVTPEHKLRIVKAWQKQGAIVAMTGDGVNDAPAVKAADIGIAMGRTGTDVTREAADMVLLDDNFSSIVSAVEEGRGILDNIQNIIHYLLAGNASEVLLVLAALLLGWPMPLLPIQILWINLITDGIPALALAAERPHKDVMRRPPRVANEPLFTWARSIGILCDGILLASVSLFGFWWWLQPQEGAVMSTAQAQAAAFCISTMAQLAFAFACRSRYQTLPELGVYSNPSLFLAVLSSAVLQILLVHTPGLQGIFFQDIPQFGVKAWLAVLGLALIPVSLVEAAKLLARALRKHGASQDGPLTQSS